MTVKKKSAAEKKPVCRGTNFGDFTFEVPSPTSEIIGFPLGSPVRKALRMT